MTTRYRYHGWGQKPDSKQIFVFGSNLAGRHGAAAALTAKNQYGAVYGVGQGLRGRSYALPTKDGNLVVLKINVIKQHIETFKTFARNHPDLEFYVTKVGCGLAGYDDMVIAPLFQDSPANCVFSHEWVRFLEQPLKRV